MSTNGAYGPKVKEEVIGQTEGAKVKYNEIEDFHGAEGLK